MSISIVVLVLGLVVVSTVASIVRGVLGIPRVRGSSRRALRRLGFDPSEEFARFDAALAERDTQIEDLQHRLSEMESRVDFAERLLTERSSTPVPK
jgi:hypothetical protein